MAIAIAASRGLQGVAWTIGVLLPPTVLYIILFATVPGQVQTPAFWGLITAYALVWHRKPGLLGLLDLSVGAIAIACAWTATAAYYREETIAIFGPDRIEIGLGLAALLTVIYTSWRFAGLAITILPLACLVYLGALIEEGRFSIEQVVRQLFLSTEGIFGAPLYVCVTIVFAFMVFSAFLERSGAAQVITDVAVKLVGRAKGGPAKVSVVSSAAFGTVTGAAVANVMADGMITIPMMKQAGFTPSRAAAIEAVASTGSQLAPPVMGAAAFLMAEVLGVPYLTIAMAAIVPTVFFYLSLYGAVHIWSLDLPNLGDAVHRPPPWRAYISQLHLLSPILILIISIGVFETTPAMAAALATLSVLLFSNLQRAKRFSINAVCSALREASEHTVAIAAVCAAAGIVVGTLTLTGLGQWVISYIISFSGGSALIALLLTMVTSIILGMGLPTISVYIILVVTVAPVLVHLGIPILSAHMFIFYYGVLAVITPPVAMATIAAASIAGSNVFKTGWETVRLAFLIFVFPFLFVYRDGVLLQKDLIGSLVDITAVAILAVAGTAAFFGYFFGRLTFIWRLAFGIPAILSLIPTDISEATALVLLSVLVLARFLVRQKQMRGSENHP